MALYSWFSRTNTKTSNKSVKNNNDLLKASESVKCIENYTMWPTAKIKQNAKAILPNYSKVDDKPPKHQQVILPTTTALAIIKNQTNIV